VLRDADRAAVQAERYLKRRIQDAGEPTINIRSWRETTNKGVSDLTQRGRARGFAESARSNGPAYFIIKTFDTDHRVRGIDGTTINVPLCERGI
jgi:hypothetical protein